MRRRPGLGRGLDALIPQGEPYSPSSGVFKIPIEKITPNPHQPRSNSTSENLVELADSIQKYGIIQPLIVTHKPGTDQYTLIAGERRLLAAKQAGLDSVPALLRETNDQERLELALIENIQREDLTPLETAEAYRQLVEDFGLSHSQVAERVSKNRVTVTNTLRLLKLPPITQQALIKGQISEGHARAILGIHASQDPEIILNTILNQQLNVRQTEEYARKLNLVINVLDLENFPNSVHQALPRGEVSQEHLLTIKTLPTAEAQLFTLQSILEKGLTVSQTLEYVRKLSGEKTDKKVTKGKSPELIDLEKRLETTFETKVTLKPSPKGGTLTIHYYSDEHLNALIDRFINKE
jgi:ParB family chromosome partitioning protein